MSNRQEAPHAKRLLIRALPDERLLSMALSGDAVAFSDLYRRYRSRVYGFCLSRLRERAAAEDCTQETFLRLLDADETEVRDARAWLFRIAGRVTLDALRRGPKRHETPTEAETLAAVAGSVASEPDAEESARRLFTALRRLPARQRTALVLRGLHGSTSAEIAQALRTSAPNADVIVSRARQSLGREYGLLSELPPACADTIALAFGREANNLTGEQTRRLEAHLASCPRCSQDVARLEPETALRGLLPLLAPTAGRQLLAGLQLRLSSLVHQLASVDLDALPRWVKTTSATMLVALGVGAGGVAVFPVLHPRPPHRAVPSARVAVASVGNLPKRVPVELVRALKKEVAVACSRKGSLEVLHNEPVNGHGEMPGGSIAHDGMTGDHGGPTAGHDSWRPRAGRAVSTSGGRPGPLHVADFRSWTDHFRMPH